MSHQWETCGSWGVVYGVSRCRRCRVVARPQILRDLCVVEDAHDQR